MLENQSAGSAWRAFCPEGNETTSHNFLTPPTHIQTGTGCVWRKWLFMTQITLEWAHLVIRDQPMPTWSQSRMKPLLSMSLWTLAFKKVGGPEQRTAAWLPLWDYLYDCSLVQDYKIQSLQRSDRLIKTNLESFEQGLAVHCSSASAACLYRWAKASWGGVGMSLH